MSDEENKDVAAIRAVEKRRQEWSQSESHVVLDALVRRRIVAFTALREAAEALLAGAEGVWRAESTVAECFIVSTELRDNLADALADIQVVEWDE